MITLLIILTADISGILADATSSCSPASRQNEGLESCLTGIKNAFTDPQRFWFGSQLDSRCPPQMAFTMNCLDQFRSDGYTLEERTFKTTTFFNKDLIDRYIDVTFTSEPATSLVRGAQSLETLLRRNHSGNYSGCEHEAMFKSEEVFSLDPLSSHTYTPFSLRSLPAVSVSGPSSVGKTYTLMVVDVASRVLHAFFTNFDGSDLSTATEVKAYSGPLNFRAVANVYVFLLFEQPSSSIQVPASVLARLVNMTTHNVTDAVQSLSLTGPVAANWFLSGFDTYSVQRMRSYGVGENCAAFITEALVQHQRPWAPPNTELSVFMKVELGHDQYSYEICGKTHRFEAETVNVDPLGNKLYDPAQLQTSLLKSLTVKLNMNKLFPDSSKDFNNKHYTMLVIDPDVPVPCVATEAAPMVHMAAVDIPVSPGVASGPPTWGVPPSGVIYATLDLASGKEIRSLWGPNPPNDPAHVYYFLLFEQPSAELGITSHEDENYKKYHKFECSTRLPGRCGFVVADFAAGNNLKLVGASWFHAQLTDWKAFTTSSVNQTAYCLDPKGWDWGVQRSIDACPPVSTPGSTPGNTSGVYHASASYTFISLLVLLACITCVLRS